MPEPAATAELPEAVERLILCFDGTWNTPEDQTNVSRIYAAIADRASGCPGQLKFYDAGVGTTWRSYFSGGAFGEGLDRNILEGYSWLINEFARRETAITEETRARSGSSEGDLETFHVKPEIFLFGFSRGAFTARSLAGLISRCGVPKPPGWGEEDREAEIVDPSSAIVGEAWDLYRTPPDRIESEMKAEGVRFSRDLRRARDFRERHRCWNVKIRFIGVWDTVGALGMPRLQMQALPVVGRLRYAFHDTGLSSIVENAYQALAIDEHREDFAATLWTSAHLDLEQKVEQCWFPGAHANVGGGYEDDLLADPPLHWIADKAQQLGLAFLDEFAMALGKGRGKNALPADFALRGDEHLGMVRDSYGEFVYGIYRGVRTLLSRGDGRYRRPMLIDGVNETIHPTALLKWAADPSYRPRNLAASGRPGTTADPR